MSAHNLVFDAFEILEEESVVAWRSVFRVLARRAHDRRTDRLQFGIQPVDFGARFRSEREVMQRAWFPAVDCVAREGASR